MIDTAIHTQLGRASMDAKKCLGTVFERKSVIVVCEHANSPSSGSYILGGKGAAIFCEVIGAAIFCGVMWQLYSGG